MLRTSTTENTVPKLALTAQEAAAAMGIGTRLLWQLTNAGEIPAAKIGRRVVYPVRELEDYLTGRVEVRR